MVVTGRMYQLGEGVPKDYQKAMKFFLQGFNQGDEGARNPIGILLPLYIPSSLVMTSFYPEQLKSKLTKVEDWTIDDVVSWISSLNLSQR